jgi:hypothetical protein
MGKPLSATMVDCIELARTHGGELVRFQGGYWAGRNAPRMPHDGIPRPYCGGSTVNAIVTRGYAEYSEWREGRSFKFPIAIKLTEEGA